jgi:hypothetical protein
MSSVKRCRKGHAKGGDRCLTCKATNERKRYWANPKKQRGRKKRAYQSKKAVTKANSAPPISLRPAHLIDGELMSSKESAVTCSHENATQLDEFPGIFYCTDEDVFFDLDQQIVPNPYERPNETGGAHQGKAQAPATTGAKSPSAPDAQKNRSQQMKRSYKRDETLMEMVPCSHPGCKRKFPMWPQNVKPEGNYCPQEHRPQQRLAQAAQRQKRFRDRNK